MGTKVSRKHFHAGLQISEHRFSVSDYYEVSQTACHKVELFGCPSPRQFESYQPHHAVPRKAAFVRLSE